MDKESSLLKLLNLRSEEQQKINKARNLWALVKKKIKVIRMMA